MKDLGEASYILGIEIQRDRSQGLLGLSQKNYIQKVLKRFNMQTSFEGGSPMSKGDKLSKISKIGGYLADEVVYKSYAQLIESLMYAQTRLSISVPFLGRGRAGLIEGPTLHLAQGPKNVRNGPARGVHGWLTDKRLTDNRLTDKFGPAYDVEILSRFQQNPTKDHWATGKIVRRYMQKIKAHMLVYRQGKNLELMGYTDSKFAGDQVPIAYTNMHSVQPILKQTVYSFRRLRSTHDDDSFCIYELRCKPVAFHGSKSYERNQKHVEVLSLCLCKEDALTATIH
ncbi:hypothetical protein OSB04_006556 [Centaurea solstitialis]|uniref:Reverse transcriptase Ty1/copia-type domain-containing protein n=1 Tax=Centaurea solstitialis TaxID=347529 RepID=A0AA38WSR3_9ASTR|nr:hypothetical protein OSB04_006556 [Centaurea solstitialis]